MLNVILCIRYKSPDSKKSEELYINQHVFMATYGPHRREHHISHFFSYPVLCLCHITRYSWCYVVVVTNTVHGSRIEEL